MGADILLIDYSTVGTVFVQVFYQLFFIEF